MRPRRNVAVYTAGSRRVNPLGRGAGGARRVAPGLLPALRPAPAESFRPGRRRAGKRLPRPKRGLYLALLGGSVAAAIEQVLRGEASVSARPMPLATAATLERSTEPPSPCGVSTAMKSTFACCTNPEVSGPR